MDDPFESWETEEAEKRRASYDSGLAAMKAKSAAETAKHALGIGVYSEWELAALDELEQQEIEDEQSGAAFQEDDTDAAMKAACWEEQRDA